MEFEVPDQLINSRMITSILVIELPFRHNDLRPFLFIVRIIAWGSHARLRCHVHAIYKFG